ncbi:serine hydrolase domain-containing protein [Mucilaginibacter xinganensis]|uniref:CubicO group peptidase, beta-lactamase class C family n=1 Tax=Mucilaginibacter xinganensis TaxID=1234841 RepID=A0A223NUZ1_9SPHI|nr:serine hydrolase domain-containing protein [Mucilaginibacter xinganensis]ASU33448.1 CubicO group peptidase, beta-lactamase class C family [Mucilaginibacter xinganensis]
MKQAFKTFFLLSTILISTIDNLKAQENKVAEIDSLIKSANRLGLFNGNVLVADNNHIIYKTAIGFADASKKTGLTESYRFHIGSIAKEFNAVGIMILQEQGKLSLDDRISKYLPGLPEWAGKISIKNLMQYTSGLPDVKWATVKNDADNMADLKKLDKLNFEPGTDYNYNNNNVFLQRRIIEKVSGLTFNQFVQQKILKPCGMDTAIIDPTDADVLIAKGYNDAYQQDSLTVPISGWTCLTLADFYKWANCISTFKLITPASTRQILYPVGPNKQAGLGGGSMDGDKLATHIHDGSSRNYQALLTDNALKGRVVIVMTNNKQGNVYDINRAIQAILDGKPYCQLRKSILKYYQQALDTLNGGQIISFYNNLKPGMHMNTALIMNRH